MAESQGVLGSFILGSNKNLTDYLSWACLSCRGMQVHKVLYELPPLHYLIRLLNTYDPEIVFLDLDRFEEALPLARDIEVALPGTALIGFSDNVTRGMLQKAASYGVGEILQAPFGEQAVVEAIARAIENGQRAERSELIVFQPAKGGSGATTVALNVARSLAGDWRQRVLLLEADLHSGPLSFLLEQDNGSSIVDAIDHCESLDDSAWKELVTNVHGVDLLLAPRTGRKVTASPWSCQRLLTFAAIRYDMVVVDLPGSVLELFGPVLSRATQAYVVCNPDKISLLMATRRLKDLEERGVDPGALDVVVNRFPDSAMKLRVMENVIRRPLPVELPASVTRGRSSLLGGLAHPNSRFAKACRSFAKVVAGEGRTRAVQPAVSRWRGLAGLLHQTLAVAAPGKRGGIR